MMRSDDKKSDLPDGPNQLGDKEENPSIENTIKDSAIAWTPGEDRAMVAQIYTKGGLTSSPIPVPKQGAPIRKPLFDNKSGPSSM
jgi:hypothetical protein